MASRTAAERSFPVQRIQVPIPKKDSFASKDDDDGDAGMSYLPPAPHRPAIPARARSDLHICFRGGRSVSKKNMFCAADTDTNY